MSSSLPNKKNVLVADSSRMQSQLLVNALHRRPEFHVSACRLDSDAILTALAASPAHVILVSHDQHQSQGLGMVRRIHLAYPEIPKVLLVESYDRPLVVNALRSGARGIFCFTKSPFRALCRCITRVSHGEIWVNTEQLQFLIDVITQVPSLRVVNAQGDQLLTPREEQVVALVAEGLSNRDIAHELKLSEHTVKKYLFRIFDKLGISTRVELVLYAVNHGDSRQAEWLPSGS